jgi:hypothetical protein
LVAILDVFEPRSRCNMKEAIIALGIQISMLLYATGVAATQSSNRYKVDDWDGDACDDVALRQIVMDYDCGGIQDFSQAYGNGNSEDEYLSGDRKKTPRTCAKGWPCIDFPTLSDRRMECAYEEDCGRLDEPCCPNAGPYGECVLGTTCVSGTCKTCGVPGFPCCKSGTACQLGHCNGLAGFGGLCVL